jgi:L-glyceraldehyde 3-phosphate reductase
MFKASPNRYKTMKYNRAGNLGIKFPVLSFGLWNNFSVNDDYEKCKEIIFEAFNNGITHFDLANNYGPYPGHAEEYFGRILKDGLMKYRDELIISTKAGYTMWDGPYQNGGSRKYLISSLNQSLSRMGLDYVDIFYHHRQDIETDIYETMIALRDIVLSGKALYIGLSNYDDLRLKQATSILKELNVPYLIYQPSYSLINRKLETYSFYNENSTGGFIAYSILAQGLLTNKYVNGIPEDSRIGMHRTWMGKETITPKYLSLVKGLDVIASKRGINVAQLAILWSLRDPKMTTVLISVSKLSQLYDNLEVINQAPLLKEEIEEIDKIYSEYIN